MTRFILALALAALSTFAHADTAVSGTVRELSAVSGAGHAPGNQDIRVVLNNVSSMCPATTDSSWAYINADDPNFKGIVTMLSLGLATGKPVTIYSNPATTPYGSFCLMTWVHVFSQ